jgi:predicted amidohydrolase
MAREHGIWVIGSVRERNAGLPRNTCLVYRPDGTLETKYAKVHPFSPSGEDRCYAPGDDIALFRVGNLVLGIAICYDLRFPELFTLYRDAGADAVIVPSAWPAERLGHFTLFVRARACEQQIYVFGVNTTGKTPVDTYSGGSLCAGPAGEVVAGAGDGEELVCADLLHDCVQAARRAFCIRGDRRDDCYARIRGTL